MHLSVRDSFVEHIPYKRISHGCGMHTYLMTYSLRDDRIGCSDVFFCIIEQRYKICFHRMLLAASLFLIVRMMKRNHSLVVLCMVHERISDEQRTLFCVWTISPHHMRIGIHKLSHITLYIT